MSKGSNCVKFEISWWNLICPGKFIHPYQNPSADNQPYTEVVVVVK